MITTAAPALVPTAPAHGFRSPVDQTDIVHSVVARGVLSILRLATGFIFLWAFFEKTFGLGFSTTVERAWINGGAPSQGFLNSPAVIGPLQPFFSSIASPLGDELFMAGMLGIGLAVMLGIGLRVSAVAAAGETAGLGRPRRSLPVVRSNPWLR